MASFPIFVSQWPTLQFTDRRRGCSLCLLCISPWKILMQERFTSLRLFFWAAMFPKERRCWSFPMQPGISRSQRLKLDLSDYFVLKLCYSSAREKVPDGALAEEERRLSAQIHTHRHCDIFSGGPLKTVKWSDFSTWVVRDIFQHNVMKVQHSCSASSEVWRSQHKSHQSLWNDAEVCHTSNWVREFVCEIWFLSIQVCEYISHLEICQNLEECG